MFLPAIIVGVVAIVVVIIVIIAWLWVRHRILFIPNNNKGPGTNEVYEDITLPNGNNIWYFHNSPIKVPSHGSVSTSSMPTPNKTVLFFHGNTGNITHRSYVIDVCKMFQLDLVVVDYRGYGKSEGFSSTTTMLYDADVVFNYLKKRVGENNIIIWGESIGGAPAIFVASKYKVDRLVVFSTFSDYESIARHNGYNDCTLINGITWIIGELPNEESMRSVRCPVIIVHSMNDDLIPYTCANKLYKACPHNDKKLITIQGKHSSPDISVDQFLEIMSFCCSGRQCSKDDAQIIVKELRDAAMNI